MSLTSFLLCLKMGDAERQILQQRWGLHHDPNCKTELSYAQGKLQLSHQDLPKITPLCVDFVTGKAAHRRKFGGGKQQTLVKAIGLKNAKQWQVLDATAGLGRDAFVLASFGCTVTLLERHPVVAALLEDGLQRAYLDPEIGVWMQERMQLLPHQLLLESADLNAFDAVYLDPMYPHQDKSALVKKEMQLFQMLIGADLDADALLPAALAKANKRVVVKRPKGATPLNQQVPDVVFEMKKNRFDVYIKAASNT
jgi:16S rRNA (guanine1516-N2)-methyltransferase